MKIEPATLRRLRDALVQSGQRESGVFTPAYAILARENLLTDEEKQALARVDATAETMFLMMAADDQSAVQEKDAIRGAIRELTEGVLQDGTIEVMLERYAEALAKEGRQGRLRQLAESVADVPEQAETAFTLAAAVALADEQVVAQETAFIRQLAEWFHVSPERTAQILSQLEDDRSQSA